MGDLLEEALLSARKKGALPNMSYDPSDFAIAYPNKRLPIPNSSMLKDVITDEMKQLWLIDKHMEINVWCPYPSDEKENLKLSLKVASDLTIENVLTKVLVMAKSKHLLVNPSSDPSRYFLYCRTSKSIHKSL